MFVRLFFVGCFLKIDRVKRVYLFLIIPAIVVSMMLIFLWSKHDEEREISERISQHIKIVNISNNISGFVKWAEGHLFMSLMFNNMQDRDKFYEKIENLNVYVAELHHFNLNVNDSHTAQQIKISIDKMIEQGNVVLNSYDLHKNKKNIFSSPEFTKQLNLFHYLSDDIRELGVDLVRSSSKSIEKDKKLIEKEMTLKNKFLMLFSFLVNLFLFIISYQYGKLNSSRVRTNVLCELSYSDSLTGVGNRRKFDEEFEKQWKLSQRTGKEFYLLIIDIDYFKSFNDYYGHTEGDRCLKKVAHLLKNIVSRQTDTVCRYGGEEFAIIMSETTNIMEVAEKCRKGIERLKIANNDSKVSKYLTVSVGAGEVLGDIELSYIDGVKKVDTALYLAKRQGRNQTVRV